jgi:isomaltose glucohydrolase
VPGAPEAVRVAARYLSRFWDQPCYDWWEEYVDQRHVSTLGAVHAGLRAAIATDFLGDAATRAAAEAVEGIAALVEAEGVAPGGHLRKWLGSDEVDASLLACVYPFELFPVDHPVAVATVAEVDGQLAREGGVHRYLADTFYGGGRWVLLAGFLGLNHAVAGRREAALRHLDWMAAQATADGELPESPAIATPSTGSGPRWTVAPAVPPGGSR